MRHPGTAAELERQLRGLLDEVRAGRMDADEVERARLEGAVIALGAVLGRAAPEILVSVGGGSGAR